LDPICFTQICDGLKALLAGPRKTRRVRQMTQFSVLIIVLSNCKSFYAGSTSASIV
jgi:hypothetical protein